MPAPPRAGNRTMPPNHPSDLGFLSGGNAKDASVPGWSLTVKAGFGMAVRDSPAATLAFSDLVGSETVAGQTLLSGRRENELRKAPSRRRRAGDHGQAVMGSNRQAFRQFHDLLFGVLRLRLAGGSAISEENVGATFADMP